jgi:hypothetical protein
VMSSLSLQAASRNASARYVVDERSRSTLGMDWQPFEKSLMAVV